VVPAVTETLNKLLSPKKINSIYENKGYFKMWIAILKSGSFKSSVNSDLATSEKEDGYLNYNKTVNVTYMG
jgi:hypothetical protein